MSPTTNSFSRKPEEAIAKFNKWAEDKDFDLQRALEYEGKTMGHCVGGYCPDVLEGRSRIFSLRDKRGEPHVTVEVRPNPHPIGTSRRGDEFPELSGFEYGGPYSGESPYKPSKEQLQQIHNRAQELWSTKGTGLAGDVDRFYQQASNEILGSMPEQIIQIKGKGNAKPKENYIPFVQDFVRGGKWTKIGDLHNADLIPMGKDKYVTQAEAKEQFEPRAKKALEFLQTHPAFEEQRAAKAQKMLDDYDFDKQRELEKIYGQPLFPGSSYSATELASIIKNPEEWTDSLNDYYPSLNRWLEEAEKGMQHYKYGLPEEGMAAGGAPNRYPTEQERETMRKLRESFLPAVKDAERLKRLRDSMERAEQKKVSFSDNPDTMMMELGELHMSKAGAVADALKAAKAAVKAEGELTLPSKLPRAKPRTKEELRPYAQQMAEATRGDFYRPDPAKSVNPAGKSFEQWKMEQGLVHDIRPTAKHQDLPRSDIEKQKGMVKMGISGDTTVAEKVLHEAGPYALDIPSPQHGGALYGLGGEGAWASNNPIAENVQKRINEISQAYGDAPVLGQYMQMGKLGSDFALHFADANLRAIDLSKMTNSQIEAVNDLIRKGSKKSGERPSFPGIEDKESAYLHFAVDPELRKHFNAIMQKPTYTEPLGLPDGRIIHHAITEPELRDLPVTTTGFSQMELNPGFDPSSLPLSAHPTYSNVIPHKPQTGLTRTPVHIPAPVEFPDVTEYLTKTGPRIYDERDMTRMYQTSTPRQIVDQQHIDEIKMFEELMKEYGGKKEGGAIHVKPKKMAAGGELTAEDLEIEERPL
jgi:hypothetical protein